MTTSKSNGTQRYRDRRAGHALLQARYAIRGLGRRYSNRADFLTLIAAIEIFHEQLEAAIPREQAIVLAARCLGLGDGLIDSMKCDIAADWRPVLTLIPGGEATNGNAE